MLSFYFFTRISASFNIWFLFLTPLSSWSNDVGWWGQYIIFTPLGWHEVTLHYNILPPTDGRPSLLEPWGIAGPRKSKSYLEPAPTILSLTRAPDSPHILSYFMAWTGNCPIQYQIMCVLSEHFTLFSKFSVILVFNWFLVGSMVFTYSVQV